MAENLKTTRYRNGDLIGTTTPATLNIRNENTPKYQWAYNGDESNIANYGRLYTWYAATDSRNICPAGWHVPTNSEWTTLTNYLGGQIGAGGKLKETGTAHWESRKFPNRATNETGFTALPGGCRDYNETFSYIGLIGYWWSATEFGSTSAWFRSMNCNYSDVDGNQTINYWGLSVRCVRD